MGAGRGRRQSSRDSRGRSRISGLGSPGNPGWPYRCQVATLPIVKRRADLRRGALDRVYVPAHQLTREWVGSDTSAYPKDPKTVARSHSLVSLAIYAGGIRLVPLSGHLTARRRRHYADAVELSPRPTFKQTSGTRP